MLTFLEPQRRNDCVNPSSNRVELCALTSTKTSSFYALRSKAEQSGTYFGTDGLAVECQRRL